MIRPKPIGQVFRPKILCSRPEPRAHEGERLGCRRRQNASVVRSSKPVEWKQVLTETSEWLKARALG